MGDAARQILGAGSKQENTEGAAHELFEELPKMRARYGIKTGEGFIEQEQAGGTGKGARQLNTLGFAI